MTADEAEIRLDRWFRRHFPTVTQGAIQKLCRTGQIRVDGKRAEAATRLAAGQAVRVPPLPDAPAPDLTMQGCVTGQERYTFIRQAPGRCCNCLGLPLSLLRRGES